MTRTPQYVYASNLLHQSLGYPLRNPRPKDEFDREGFRIGDIGYVDHNGRFNFILNISSPPEELRGRCPSFSLSDQPVGELELRNGDVLMAGVERRNVEGPRDVYEFTTDKTEGAILILPDGASRYELRDEVQLKQIREHAEEYALEWCRFAKRGTLYLITAAYKSKSWTLGSFHDGLPGKKILVKRDGADNSYWWTHEISVDHPYPPEQNFYVNQTVLIRGFKVTVRWDWLPIVQRVEKTEWWITSLLASLWSTVSRQWLTRITVNNIPTPNLSQPLHPLEIINRVLLEENPGFNVAITHDNDWVKMLERGLSPGYLMQEDKLREFVVKEHMWGLDSDHDAVYLRSHVRDFTVEHAPARDSSSHPRSSNSRLAIIYMRLEGIDLDRIYAGVCICVQFGPVVRRTRNKPHADIVEWDDEVALPSDDPPIDITVCGVFQLGSTLGTRIIFNVQMIKPEDFLGDTRMMRLSLGKAGSCSSLLITLGRQFTHLGTHSSPEETSDFVEKTNLGLRDLYSYHDCPNEEHLERARESFRCALKQCGRGSPCRVIAIFDLATSEFIRCLAFGEYDKLNVPIKLYAEALALCYVGHPDRPAILLLLAQTLLSRYGEEYDEAIVTQIWHLLAEIDLGNSRDLQTSQVIARTCRLYRAVNSGDLTEVDRFIRDLDCGRYVPPYGYYDLPHILHKLGVACWDRFQQDMDLRYLNKSIALNKEALCLIPDEHNDKKRIVDYLGRSFLKHIEVSEELTDIDTSNSLIELGWRVTRTLDDMSKKNTAVSSDERELSGQMVLASATDSVVGFLEQEVPLPRIPVLQNLIDGWREKDGVLEKCKRQLGLLLSFLGGEGEIKMRERLAKLDWPFKEYVTKETIRVMEGHIASFEGSFETKLGIKLRDVVLMCGSAGDVVTIIVEDDIHHAICDVLEGNNWIFEAIAFFRWVMGEQIGDTNFHRDLSHWELDFRHRCKERLRKLGDAAADSQNYHEAAEYFLIMLSLIQTDHPDSILKQSKARAFHEWQMVEFDPGSHRGYTIQHMSPNLDINSAYIFDDHSSDAGNYTCDEHQLHFQVENYLGGVVHQEGVQEPQQLSPTDVQKTLAGLKREYALVFPLDSSGEEIPDDIVPLEISHRRSWNGIFHRIRRATDLSSDISVGDSPRENDPDVKPPLFLDPSRSAPQQAPQRFEEYTISSEGEYMQDASPLTETSPTLEALNKTWATSKHLPVDEEAMIRLSLENQHTALKCFEKVFVLLYSRLDDEQIKLLPKPQWSEEDIVGESRFDTLALTIIYDMTSNFTTSRALLDFHQTLYILSFLIRHPTLRQRFVVGSKVIQALVLALDWTAEHSNPSLFILVTDSLCYLIRDNRAIKPVQAAQPGLSAAPESRSSNQLLASLKVTASSKIFDLAKVERGRVGSAAVEVLVAMNVPLSRHVYFTNILSYLCNALPKLHVEEDKAHLTDNIDDLPHVLLVNGSEALNEEIMHQLVLTIKSHDINERIMATVAALKLFRTPNIRAYCSRSKVLDIFMQQLKKRATCLLAAYALMTCLKYDMWTSDDFTCVAPLIVAMVEKCWFNHAIGRVEGCEIFRGLMTSIDLRKRVVDHGVVDTLVKNLESDEYHKVRMSLSCLHVLGGENSLDLSQVVVDNVTRLKHEDEKVQRKGVKVLTALAQISIGERAIKPQLIEMVKMILPSSDDQFIPRSRSFWSAAALCDLSENKSIREMIQASPEFNELKTYILSKNPLVDGIDKVGDHPSESLSR